MHTQNQNFNNFSNFQSPQIDEPLIHDMDEFNQDNTKAQNTSITKKCCTLITTSIFVIILLTILYYWLVIKPKQPVFTVDKAVIVHGYNITHDNRLNAAFNFEIKAFNQNFKLSLYFESVEIKAYHGGQVVGYIGVYPFLQVPQNVTYLGFGGVASDMPLFEAQGEVDFNVEMKGRFWYKLGELKTNMYKLKANCFPVVVYFNSTRDFESTNCFLQIDQ